MTDHDSQEEFTREEEQEHNNKYLATALQWLHLRLRRLTDASPSEREGLAAPERSQNLLFPRRRDKRGVPLDTVSDAEIARVEQRLVELGAQPPYPALIRLSQRFGLAPFEREVLLLCLALELDPNIAGLYARVQGGEVYGPYPTFALAMALFDDPSWEALSPDRPLRYWQMIEINQPGAQPLTTSALRADERILNYIKLLNHQDDRLSPLMVPLEHFPGALPPSQQAVVDFIINTVDRALPFNMLPVIQLLGNDSISKRLVAERSAAGLGLRAYLLPADMLPANPAEMDTLIRLWRRETTLRPVVLYLEAAGNERGERADELTDRLHRFLSRYPGLFFLDTRENWPGLSHTSYTVEVQKPMASEQAAVWRAVLGAWAGDSPEALSAQFQLNLPGIEEIASRVLAEEAGGAPQAEPPDEILVDDTIKERLRKLLWQACLDATRPQLDSLAQRIDTRATWKDIVLPAQEETLLREIARQVGLRGRVYDEWGFREKMNRGLGINALFAGPSGTGKTMAAEVIANELNLYLYRIDLSAVVSKYIGETEKNLRRLFDAAEDSGAILFFDEADALFGKRSEVKDSHDRYANIEINYLLQRMEAYRGLAILATNLKSALDTAFLRRLRFIVNFPFPAATQRKEIWKRAFPPQVPKPQDPSEQLDYDRLAQLNLTGGSIHNIALNAAFLAAGQPESERRITMELALRAAQTEFRKLGLAMNEFRFPTAAQVKAGAGG